MRTLWVCLLRELSALIVLLLLAACGGGGGDESVPPPNPVWLSINTPYSATVAELGVSLSGRAYCEDCPPPKYYACEPGYLGDSSVNITWRNRTTGATGSASHGKYGTCNWMPILCNCYVTSYRHVWNATVPVALGDNDIEVTAQDSSGNTAAAAAAVKRTLPATVLYRPRGIVVDTVNDELLVASSGNLEVIVYERTASGEATPKRTITGPSTGLDHPYGVAIDTITNRVFVTNPGALTDSVTIYARTASGDAFPSRTLSGASTSLDEPHGIAIYPPLNEISVANSGNNSVRVYDGVVQLRAISGASTRLSTPYDVAVDPVNDEVFVLNNANNSITVYPRTASGDSAPIRTISGASTSLSRPQGIALDTANNEIYVTNQLFEDDTCNDSITVFARTANGDVAPLRTLLVPSVYDPVTSPSCRRPYGIAVDTVHDEVFVSRGDYYIYVYSRTAAGNAAPMRTIVSPNATP